MKTAHGLLPRRVEGLPEAHWILMDYLDVVVHVFTPETREYYRLEQLWGEAPARALGAAPRRLELSAATSAVASSFGATSFLRLITPGSSIVPSSAVDAERARHVRDVAGDEQVGALARARR